MPAPSLAAVPAAAATPVPAASMSPLPYIGGTHASRLCTTVRETVAPVVLGLLTSDRLIVAGRHRYDVMGGVMKSHADVMTDRGFAPSDPLDDPQADVEFGRIRLDRVVNAMAHDLVVVNGMLRDDKRFPNPPRTGDDLLALQLRAQLQATADAQNEALNVINGVLETDRLYEMRGRALPQMARRNWYRHAADAIGEQQGVIARLETKVDASVAQAVSRCGGGSAP